MRLSVLSAVFAVALFVECAVFSAAIPASKTEDGFLEQEAPEPLLSTEAAENALSNLDGVVLGKSGGPKVIVVADGSLWRNLRELSKGLYLYRQRVGENGFTLDRRDVGQDASLSILRRDTMRCMVGRVYRPCWEV